MKVFILLTVMANCFNLIQRSTGDKCTTNTKCLQPDPKIELPIEIGIIYDLYDDVSKNQPVINLDTVACQVIQDFNGSLIFKRYPGASVKISGNDIKCNDDCFRNREDACKGIINSEYFTQAVIAKTFLENCIYSGNSDWILKDNGALRCKAGIPRSKIPALMFNQKYDPCHTFSSANELKQFLCSTYKEALKGKGCN